MNTYMITFNINFFFVINYSTVFIVYVKVLIPLFYLITRHFVECQK